jgi:thiol:disulfide interchange protein DsbD
MAKRSILKFLSCLALWFAGKVFAVESAGVLPPEQAFQFTYQVKKADRLLLSWNIAPGYYLYRHKFKFVSLTPGITVGEPSFPASHTKHDEFFGDVDIYRDHLQADIMLQRQDPGLNKLKLEVAFQGCADAGDCYIRQFNLIGPPAMLFFGPDQQERSAYRVVGYLKADKFLDIINRVFSKPVS